MDQSECALRDRFPRQVAFLQARFSPKGYLGLQLTIGALVLISATWFFVSLAEDVMEGDPLTLVDARFSAWLHAHANPKLTIVMLVVSHAHKLWVSEWAYDGGHLPLWSVGSIRGLEI